MIVLDRMIHALLVIVSATTVDPAATVAVVPVCDALRASESAAWMALALSERGWQVVPAAEASSRPCVADNLRRLKATFREARALFEEQLRHEAAQIQLSEAAQVFDDKRTLFRSPALFAKIHFYLGWIAFEAGRPEEARKHFARVAHVTPDWRPSSRRFPPRVVAAFTQTSARVQAVRGGLAVQASPAKADVWVDGNKRCAAPCKVEGLSAGAHFVAVTREGYASHLALVTIEAEKMIRLRVELPADPRERLAALLDAGKESQLVELAWSIGPAAVVLLAPATNEGQVTLVATGSALAGTRTWTVPAARGAVAEVASALGAPPEGPAPFEPPGNGDGEPEQELWLLSQWWFWTAVGVVAATGVVVGVTTSQREVHFTVRP
jgi:hypothetical protein